MVILVLIVIVFAKLYYGQKNKNEDPRIKEARVLYGKYNNFIEKNSYRNVLLLLDTIETIYHSVKHYQQSYEMGVLNNNRGAVYLTIALHECDSGKTRNKYFDTAASYFNKSIGLYKNWMDEYENLDEQEIKTKIIPAFNEDQPGLKGYNAEKIRENRVDDIILAQAETPRRLSVSYTNLGIIKRHQHRFEKALNFYEKALELWEDNHTAQNNLNILLGKPVEKQNFLKKLFPPERIK